MCDFSALFGGGGKSQELLGLMREQQAQTARANDAAEQAAQSAKERAAASLATPADSETARLASEKRIRRLLQTRGPEQAASLGSAPVSYQVLMGA